MYALERDGTLTVFKHSVVSATGTDSKFARTGDSESCRHRTTIDVLSNGAPDFFRAAVVLGPSLPAISLTSAFLKLDPWSHFSDIYCARYCPTYFPRPAIAQPRYLKLVLLRSAVSCAELRASNWSRTITKSGGFLLPELPHQRRNSASQTKLAREYNMHGVGPLPPLLKSESLMHFAGVVTANGCD